MRLATTAIVTEEITIEPKLKKRLMLKFQTIADLKAQRALLQEQIAAEVADIRELREQVGVESLSLDGGYTTTNVKGTSKSLDKKKFVSLGGSLQMLENATVWKSKREYELVTTPGVEDSNDN